MRNISPLIALALSTALVGCNMDADSEAPDINVTVNYPDTGDDGDDGGDTQDITNTALPVYEDFSASDIQTFFSADYKALATEAESGEDDFYYSLAGVYDADGSLDPDGGNWITADADQMMRIGNARYSVAQTVSADKSDEADPRKDTSTSADTESWGELDLSAPYTISFCVVAVPTESSSSDFQIYVDNNTTSESSSIHGGGNDGSRIFDYPVNNLVAGQRVEINVPGNTTVQDGGDAVGVKSVQIGTEHSFLEVRVSSGGYAVIDDFLIESQATPYDGQLPDCSTKTTEYATVNPAYGDTEEPEPVTGTPFDGLPLIADFSVGFDNFFGTDEATDFLSISNNDTQPFYTAKSGSSRMFFTDDTMTFGDARWYAGYVSGSTADGGTAVGDMDLSVPYRISFEVVKAADAGNFMIYVDNTESGISDGANSPLGMDAVLYQNTLDQLTDGQTVTIDSSVGTSSSFLQFRCDSSCGQPTADDLDQGITIRNLVVEYTSGEPEPDPAIVEDDFDAATADTFFTADYKSLPDDATSPMYVATSGGSNVSFADGALSMANARFTIGAIDPLNNQTADGVEPVGDLDLSQPYTVSFQVLGFENASTNAEGEVGKFQVYVDNNTTSSSNSIHGSASKVIEMSVGDISEFPYTVQFTDEDLTGTATSFIQIRADSRVGNLVIDNLSIEAR